MTASNPTWSADGKRIAFARAHGDSSEIYVMNADGSGQRRLSRLTGREVSLAYLDFRPQWSPDGKKIAFLRFSGEDFFLWVINADGTGQRDVLEGRTVGEVFSWSPGGRKIAFESGGIQVVNVDGSGLRDLTQDEEDEGPAWSPDGKKIAFWKVTGVISVMNADGSGVRKLTPKGSLSILPAWSPDGRKISFLRGPESNRTLWIINADGSGQRKLAAQVDPDSQPVWQPTKER